MHAFSERLHTQQRLKEQVATLDRELAQYKQREQEATAACKFEEPLIPSESARTMHLEDRAPSGVKAAGKQQLIATEFIQVPASKPQSVNERCSGTPERSSHGGHRAFAV